MNDFKIEVKIELIKRCKDQRWLAKTIGIQESQLSEILNGKRHGKRTNEQLVRISKLLGIKKPS